MTKVQYKGREHDEAKENFVPVKSFLKRKVCHSVAASSQENMREEHVHRTKASVKESIPWGVWIYSHLCRSNGSIT